MPSSPKRKVLTHTDSVKEHIHDYCSKTSIHGIKYVGEKGRPFAERIWWLGMLVLAMGGSFYNIHKIWDKWNTSPVIVSFSERATPVWQVPFPAVTLCTETKSKATLFNFSAAFTSEVKNQSTLKAVGDISLVCGQSTVVKNGPEFTNGSTIDTIRKYAPSLEESLTECTWKNEAKDCSKIFIPIITEDGLCFTFNMLDYFELFRVQGDIQPSLGRLPNSVGWSLEKGYASDAPLDTYPSRALEAGTSAGLTIQLTANINDFDYRCRGPVQGFTILLHDPAEVPRVSERYFRAPMRQEVLVAVSPEIMNTNEALRDYSPKLRQCYFPSERYLAYFKVYTQQNCELECITNFTADTCGCIAFYMPRNRGLPVCGAGKKVCLFEAVKKIREKELEMSYSKSETKICDCLPPCTSLQYDAAVSQADYDWTKGLDTANETEGVVKTRLSIFFKEKQFITSHRSELFGSSDFLASCGGVLGLFSGISLLSLVEVIYYATLRFYNNIKRQRRSPNREENVTAVFTIEQSQLGGPKKDEGQRDQDEKEQNKKPQSVQDQKQQADQQ